jgi:hypothetical protein
MLCHAVCKDLVGGGKFSCFVVGRNMTAGEGPTPFQKSQIRMWRARGFLSTRSVSVFVDSVRGVTSRTLFHQAPASILTCRLPEERDPSSKCTLRQ